MDKACNQVFCGSKAGANTTSLNPIKSKGGIVLDLNTDSISCSFPNDVFPFELIDEKKYERLLLR